MASFLRGAAQGLPVGWQIGSSMSERKRKKEEKEEERRYLEKREVEERIGKIMAHFPELGEEAVRDLLPEAARTPLLGPKLTKGEEISYDPSLRDKPQEEIFYAPPTLDDPPSREEAAARPKTQDVEILKDPMRPDYLLKPDEFHFPKTQDAQILKPPTEYPAPKGIIQGMTRQQRIDLLERVKMARARKILEEAEARRATAATTKYGREKAERDEEKILKEEEDHFKSAKVEAASLALMSDKLPEEFWERHALPDKYRSRVESSFTSSRNTFMGADAQAQQDMIESRIPDAAKASILYTNIPMPEPVKGFEHRRPNMVKQWDFSREIAHLDRDWKAKEEDDERIKVLGNVQNEIFDSVTSMMPGPWSQSHQDMADKYRNRIRSREDVPGVLKELREIESYQKVLNRAETEEFFTPESRKLIKNIKANSKEAFANKEFLEFFAGKLVTDREPEWQNKYSQWKVLKTQRDDPKTPKVERESIQEKMDFIYRQSKPTEDLRHEELLRNIFLLGSRFNPKGSSSTPPVKETTPPVKETTPPVKETTPPVKVPDLPDGDTKGITPPDEETQEEKLERMKSAPVGAKIDQGGSTFEKQKDGTWIKVKKD